MYSTCLFCTRPLGRNEMVEAFPVGRRLAFDAAKGRLWVVCPRCERWNLTPLEERWEAIEQCERLFGATRLRASTEHVGLARLKEGLELVRIGRPQRPELAAWRYGDQFGRRRRRNLLLTAGVVGVGTAAAVAGPALAIMAGASFSTMGLGGIAAARLYEQLRVVTRITTADGQQLALGPSDVSGVGLLPGDDGDESWALSIPHRNGPADFAQRLSWVLMFGFVPGRVASGAITVVRGPAALAAARVILPRLNVLGGSSRTVQDAVAQIDAVGTGERFFATAARERRGTSFDDGWTSIRSLPASLRLALEMAAHEESERRALGGELAELERAWRNAEQIAGIADDLLPPPAVDERMRERGDR